MKIVLISTKDTNIGDDLIRRGVQRLLTAALPDRSIEWDVVNKHQPWTVYTRNSMADAAIQRLPRGKRHTTIALRHASRTLGVPTVFTDADLIVQCGTPVMWPGVHRSEWQVPIWEESLGRSNRPPLLNLSGGSCFPWTAERPIQLAFEDDAALRMMLNRSDLVTTRDPLAKQIFEQLGGTASLHSCAAVHSGGGRVSTDAGDTLIINVMPRGGHFDWNQKLDGERWLRAVDEVVRVRAKQNTLLFLCHSADELELAERRWPGHEAVLPTTTEQYLDVAQRGRTALVNRMHAAVTLAGLGVPAIAIGTDTRLLMVEQTGQDIAYVGDADGDNLLAGLELIDDQLTDRRAMLLEREQSSFDAHLATLTQSEVLTGALSAAAVG